MITEFSITKLRDDVLSNNKRYFDKMVEQITQRIKKRAIAGEDCLWVTFIWEDGNESDIINYFEDSGIKVGSPTGPWEGGSTTYLFSWDI